jgi:hypothetical protein
MTRKRNRRHKDKKMQNYQYLEMLFSSSRELELLRKFSKTGRHKKNFQKSIAFFYSNNNQLK